MEGLRQRALLEFLEVMGGSRRHLWFILTQEQQHTVKQFIFSYLCQDLHSDEQFLRDEALLLLWDAMGGTKRDIWLTLSPELQELIKGSLLSCIDKQQQHRDVLFDLISNIAFDSHGVGEAWYELWKPLVQCLDVVPRESALEMLSSFDQKFLVKSLSEYISEDVGSEDEFIQTEGIETFGILTQILPPRPELLIPIVSSARRAIREDRRLFIAAWLIEFRDLAVQNVTLWGSNIAVRKIVRILILVLTSDQQRERKVEALHLLNLLEKKKPCIFSEVSSKRLEKVRRVFMDLLETEENLKQRGSRLYNEENMTILQKFLLSDQSPDPQEGSENFIVKELQYVLFTGNYEDAFLEALHIVPTLCDKIDLVKILSKSPIPLSQKVLLTLLTQLASHIPTDALKILRWIADCLLPLIQQTQQSVKM